MTRRGDDAPTFAVQEEDAGVFPVPSADIAAFLAAAQTLSCHAETASAMAASACAYAEANFTIGTIGDRLEEFFASA
jgi:hypothetical protein